MKATFWQRALALIIDGFIVGLPVGFFLGVVFGDPLIAKYVGIIPSWLYYALMESSSYRGTVGKRLINLEVVDTNGNSISFGRASGRYFGRFLSGIPFGIGILAIFFNKHKQCWHDTLSKCYVIYSPKAKKTTIVSSEFRDSEIISGANYYEIAQEEVDNKNYDRNLWSMAFVAHPENENLQKAEYIKLRAKSLRTKEISRIEELDQVKLNQKISHTVRRIKHYLKKIVVFLLRISQIFILIYFIEGIIYFIDGFAKFYTFLSVAIFLFFSQILIKKLKQYFKI